MNRITPAIQFEAELGGLFDVKDKVAYLPGGYGGLGEAIAWGLALGGARVVVAGRSEEKAEAVAAALRGKGLEAAGLAMDATSVEAIRTSVERVETLYGGLDILVNCV